ncbi:hypothetical protein D3C80_1547060 [compost metagenome]
MKGIIKIAIKKDRKILNGTVNRVYTNVFFNAFQKSSSENELAKFSRPTKVDPNGPYSCKLIIKALITGYAVNKENAISATAINAYPQPESLSSFNFFLLVNV